MGGSVDMSTIRADI